ncbi:MAG: NAD-dependent succinate-semialdehyde dehydrogenase [Proteobacteria bacterium]|nr:NAD-dependent succinate-semialdehyde dehydrogenase [Verrucomicrobiota bacterium]NBU09988.1 NAD-dependent succinate-semialdehyde dehydrogenase [Pseudomonadota bacterium]
MKAGCRLPAKRFHKHIWPVQPKPLYLNGEFIAADKTLSVRNPATGETIAQMSTCGRDHVAQALADAHAAFQSWRNVVGRTRGDFLLKIAVEVERRKDEFARTITLENGKPLAQSAGEVAMTIDHLRWFAEEARRGYGRVIPPQVEGKRHLVIKSPIGVVAAISPWNFPLVLAVRKVAAALAAGCTVVLKPASATPLCAVLFAECVHAANLPKGAFQLVAGSAAEIAAEFLENPLCRKITFTGSTEVGKKLIAGAAAQVKPLSLELGGHSPVLVFDDADLAKAVEGTMIAKYRNTGQSCIAANRIYVQRGLAEKFIAAFVERVKALKVGSGLEPGVDIGPLINPAAVDLAMKHIVDAQAKGAQLLCGGQRWGEAGSAFLQPTVLTGVPGASLGMCDETFAPVAYVNVFDTEAEAIARANDTTYGLAAYVFTHDLNRAFRLMESLEAGMIGINDGVPTTSNAPFGGVKQSGWGRELGSDGLDAFLDTKHVSLAL